MLVRFQGEGLGPQSLTGPSLVWPTGSKAARSAGLGQSSEGRRDAGEGTDVAAASESPPPRMPGHWKVPRLNLLSPSPSPLASAVRPATTMLLKHWENSERLLWESAEKLDLFVGIKVHTHRTEIAWFHGLSTNSCFAGSP